MGSIRETPFFAEVKGKSRQQKELFVQKGRVGTMEEVQIVIWALFSFPCFYARWELAYILVSSGGHVFLWPAVTQKGLTRVRLGLGKLHGQSWVYGTSFILRITSGISLSPLGSQMRALHALLTLVPGRQMFGVAAEWRWKTAEKKRSKGYRRQVRHLHLAGRAFAQQKTLGDVLHPASLRGCTLEKQITGISLSFHTLLDPSLLVFPLEIRWVTGNHSLTQRHLLFPLLPGHNKGGSEVSRILDCYFAVCKITKAQQSHQTPSDKKDFSNKGLVIWAFSLHCPSGVRCVPVYACKRQGKRNICDSHCSIFSSCKHICSLCTQ